MLLLGESGSVLCSSNMAGADALEKQLRLLQLGSPGFKLPKISATSEASLAAAWHFNILAKLVPPPTQNML